MPNLILTKSNGTTDVTYTPQSIQGNQRVYLNESAGLTAPEQVKVTHLLRPSGAKGTDRHTVVLSKAIVESTTNAFLVVSASLQLSVPRSTEVTVTMVKDLIAQLTSFIHPSANVISLTSGGFPEGDFNVTGPFNPTMV